MTSKNDSNVVNVKQTQNYKYLVATYNTKN